MPTGSPVTADELAPPAAPAFTELPALYPPEVRGSTPAPPQGDAAGQRLLRSTRIPADLMSASLADGAQGVNFGTPVTRLRIVGEAGLVLGVGWGRAVSLLDYDDRVTLAAAATEAIIEVPAGRYFTIGNIGAAAATLPVLVIGLTP